MSSTTYAEGDIHSSKRGTGARANGGKVSLSLVPLHLLAGCGRVLMGGTIKYAPWNWAKGMLWSSSFDCLLRHLFKWWYLGEDIDPESGEHHLDHAMCNLLFLMHNKDTYPEGDNRPPGQTTRFPESLEGFAKLFDEAAYRERNGIAGSEPEGGEEEADEEAKELWVAIEQQKLGAVLEAFERCVGESLHCIGLHGDWLSLPSADVSDLKNKLRNDVHRLCEQGLSADRVAAYAMLLEKKFRLMDGGGCCALPLATDIHCFAIGMLDKLCSKVTHEFDGWDNAGHREKFANKLQRKTKELIDGDRQQAVDVANYAMFLWNLDREAMEQ